MKKKDPRFVVCGPKVVVLRATVGSVRDIQFETKPHCTLQSQTSVVEKIALHIIGKFSTKEFLDMQLEEESNEKTYNYKDMNMFFYLSLE